MASVFTLRRMMKHFEEVSGLAVNKDKSEARLSSFYLFRTSISDKGLKQLDCIPLMDKVMSATTRWAGMNTSMAGRIELLRAVITPMVTSPKTEGGFGLRRILDIDKAAICYLAWDFLLSKDRLWVAWFKHCNLRDASYWSVIPKLTHSTIWTSIVAVREILRENCSYHIGNGALIQKFLDPWCGGQFLSEVVGIPLQVQQFMQQFRIYGGADQILWNHKPFTFKDAWDACRESNYEVSWFGLVWNGGRPRWSIFSALIIQNAIMTGANLQRRGISLASRCCLCCNYDEHVDHMFVNFVYSWEVWCGLAGMFHWRVRKSELSSFAANLEQQF
ncbi:uncharacterized protein LOC132309300 [Cornus florida]|uniref:uncharacterized protein LOC132309300 n=1 Tax=Cornus florida TaxID=4283 RepID=UPI0028A04381|nr:uncharacterized protein LOC132309300 [Cornus florida]